MPAGQEAEWFQEPQAATREAGAEPATGPVGWGLCCWTRHKSSGLAFGSTLDVGHWAAGVVPGAVHAVPANATMDSTGPSDSKPQLPACGLGCYLIAQA